MVLLQKAVLILAPGGRVGGWVGGRVDCSRVIIKLNSASWSRSLAELGNRVKLGGGRGVPQKILIGILLFMLLGSPHKNLEPYHKPFWNIFENSPFSGQNRVYWQRPPQ